MHCPLFEKGINMKYDGALVVVIYIRRREMTDILLNNRGLIAKVRQM